MRKYYAIIMVLLLVSLLLFTACKQSPEAETTAAETAKEVETTVEETSQADITEEIQSSETEKPLLIGLSLSSMDEFMRQVLNVFTEEAEAIGAEIAYTEAQNEVQKQINDIEALIARQCDIIFIRALDADGLVTAVDSCAEAGIPTFEIGGIGVNTDNLSGMVTISQTQGAEITAEFISGILEKDPDLKLKVGYIWGWKGIPFIDERYYGIFNNLQEYIDSGRVTILDEQVANFNTNEAMNVVENWLQKFQDMNCIITEGDNMAIGAVNVLKAANVDFSDWYIIGFDIRELADPIREGTATGSVFMNTDLISKLSFEYGMKLLEGEEYTEPIDLGNVEDMWIMVFKGNIDEVLGQ